VLTGAIRKWRTSQARSEGAPTDVASVAAFAVITNMQNLPHVTLTKALKEPTQNLFSCVISTGNYTADTLATAFVPKLYEMIDQGKIKLEDLNAKMGDIISLPTLLKNPEFVQKRFVLSGDPSFDRWKLVLAETIGHQIVIYRLATQEEGSYNLEIQDTFSATHLPIFGILKNYQNGITSYPMATIP
jgi:hypothetical protein